MTVIPNGVDLQRVAFDEHRPGAGPGRVRHRRGRLPDRGARPPRPEQAVRHGHRGGGAAAQRRRSSCSIVGKGDERAHLEQAAREHGVADHVIFAGERHDVAAMLSAMDLFVASSKQETFGLSVLEALANGLPVLYTTCPALDGLDVTRASQVPSGRGRDPRRHGGRAGRGPAAADRRARGGEGVQHRGRHRADRRPVRAAGRRAAGGGTALVAAPGGGARDGGTRDEVLRHRRGRLHRLAPGRGTAGRRARGDRARRPEHRAAGATCARSPAIPRFRLVEGSILDAATVTELASGADWVFHLAAAVGAFVIRDRTLDSLRTNIHGTENVVDGRAPATGPGCWSPPPARSTARTPRSGCARTTTG